MHGYLMHEKLYNKFKDRIENANIAERRQKKIEDMVSK